MAKVTSKLQVTIPKRLALSYGIQPGDNLEFIGAGDTIRVIPPGREATAVDPAERLRLFDAATERQRRRERGGRRKARITRADRGWTRESLYDRGRTR